MYVSTGCHLYAVSKPGSSHLRLVVAVGKKLLVLMWKHSSAWSAWCPVSENDVLDGFQLLRVSGYWRGRIVFMCVSFSPFMHLLRI